MKEVTLQVNLLLGLQRSGSTSSQASETGSNNWLHLRCDLV